MRVLHLYRDLLKRGGIPHQTRRLIEGQANLGHQMVTASLDGDLRADFVTANPRVKVELVANGFSGIIDLRNCVRRNKIDLVHITGLWIPAHQFWAREILRTGIPYVVSTHGNLSPIGMRVRFGEKTTTFYHIWAKRLWHEWLDLPLLRHAIGVHAHSKYEEVLLYSAGIANVFVAPPGVDYGWLNLAGMQRRRRHTRVTFLHLGRLDIYHKGLDLICGAAQRLVTAGLAQRCKFLLVGPTVHDSKASLQKLASTLASGILEIRDAVWGKDKLPLWEEADYFLNLYRFAGIALAPCEAIGNGLPLLASREGNLGDWTAEASMGWTVPLNTEKLYTVINEIIKLSDTDYDLLSSNALKFARTNSWTSTGRQVVEGYSRLLALSSKSVLRSYTAPRAGDGHLHGRQSGNGM
jgi:glycosyltransferase involved in cell wall biosynthesis